VAIAWTAGTATLGEAEPISSTHGLGEHVGMLT
jgi:hypothetical protein